MSIRNFYLIILAVILFFIIDSDCNIHKCTGIYVHINVSSSNRWLLFNKCSITICWVGIHRLDLILVFNEYDRYIYVLCGTSFFCDRWYQLLRMKMGHNSIELWDWSIEFSGFLKMKIENRRTNKLSCHFSM